jgi:hypothetical protein
MGRCYCIMEQRIRAFETLWNARPATRPALACEQIEVVYRGRVYRFRCAPVITPIKGPPARYEDYEDLEDDDEW